MWAPGASRDSTAVRHTTYATSARLAYGREINAPETILVSADPIRPGLSRARRHRNPASQTDRQIASTVGINQVNTLWAKFHNDALLSVQPGRSASWG